MKETNDADDDAADRVVAIAALFKNLETSISFDVANRCVTFAQKKFKYNTLRRTPIVCYLDNELDGRVDPMFIFISIGVHYRRNAPTTKRPLQPWEAIKNALMQSVVRVMGVTILCFTCGSKTASKVLWNQRLHQCPTRQQPGTVLCPISSSCEPVSVSESYSWCIGSRKRSHSRGICGACAKGGARSRLTW